jgi:hypothetical protein
MNNLMKAYRDLVFEREQFQDARAEELLEHDPELLRLYYAQRERYQPMRELQRRLMVLTDGSNPLFELAMWMSQYKGIGDRVKEEWDELENVANDVVDAYGLVIQYLQTLVAEVRQQVAELPPLGSDEMMQRVSTAQSKAAEEAEQRYGGRYSELQRLFAAQSKNADVDSE